MSNININNLSGNGHTFGDHNHVNNTFNTGRVLTREDYYQMLLEIWDIASLSVEDYLEDKYEKHMGKNPHFVELLYKDVYKVMKDVNRPEDGDLVIENGDFALENGDFKLSGHTNNFNDAMTWLHLKILEKKLESHTIDDISLNDPFSSFIKKMEAFNDFLEEDDSSPNVKRKLQELNKKLKAERASFDHPEANNRTYDMETMTTTPKAFISYAWEDETKAWVKTFATRLRSDGIDVTLDQWSAMAGDQLPHFMEKSVRENDYVLIICTPKYKLKSDSRQGGVGYEGDIMTAEVFQHGNHRKYIPILIPETTINDLPSWLNGKYYIDLSKVPFAEEGYTDLITTIYNEKEKAPPLGKRPSFLKNVNQSAAIPQEEEQIKINGIIIDEVTSPKNDGSRGSALYTIPFELNKQPNWEWINLFIESWNHPPRFTLMHRPGIASVSGKKIILNGTDIEEVERYHRDTLKLAVDLANQRYTQAVEERKRQEELKKQREQDHKKNIENISRRLNFD